MRDALAVTPRNWRRHTHQLTPLDDAVLAGRYVAAEHLVK